ncbi:MAG: flavoprotein [Caulobacteraceae bacterium]
MKLDGLNIGFGITGSFCTYSKVVPEMEKLVKLNANVYPILSTNSATMDTRFGNAQDWLQKFEDAAGRKAACTINEAETFGPQNLLDILVIAPCTGNCI